MLKPDTSRSAPQGKTGFKFGTVPDGDFKTVDPDGVGTVTSASVTHNVYDTKKPMDIQSGDWQTFPPYNARR